MQRKTIIILLGCFVFATALVITLYAATYKVVHERNSFLRIYQKGAAVKASEFDIKFNSYYIAGITRDNIYLGNITAPLRLLLMNSTLTDSQHVKIHFKDTRYPVVYKSATVKINPPYFYLADGIKPALYRGQIGEWEVEPFSYDSKAFFTRLTPINNTSFAIRTNAAGTLANVLGKVQQDSPRIELKPGLLQKQVDGIFCTDGLLLYNRDINRLIYTYYYRNEYIVYDTNLNLDYRGYIIDTFSHAQIKVGHISSNNRDKLMDRKFVNVQSCTSGNYLFIRSNLLAKNDLKDRLSQESIIDVYDLTNSSYNFSFTLPHYNGKNGIRDFMVFNCKTLIALYDHYVVRYDLQPRYF